MAMEVEVAPLGRFTVDDRGVYEFPSGLPGFPKVTRFVFVRPEQYHPFVWMVAVDHRDLAFVTIDPALFRADYRPRLAAEDLEVVGLADAREATILAIVTVGADPATSTANLRGPVVLNGSARLGRQAILAGQDYSTQEPLYHGPSATEGRREEQGRRDRRAGADT